jgi:hypothetical protein
MTKIEAPIRVTREKKIVELDKKVFKVCEIKEKEIGTLHKKFVFIHFNGREWHVFLANSDFSETVSFAIS